jgi:hypothetical protein
MILAEAMVLTISEHMGRYKKLLQYGSAHKSRALGDHSSLGDYMFEIQHINEEENELISGTREKSAVGDSDEPKQYR